MNDGNHTPDIDANEQRIAIISVSYGSDEVLPTFFESVEVATSANILLILADNKCEVDSPARKIAGEFGAVYLPMSSNAGYGGAVNAAARILPRSVKWILVSNPDIVLSAKAIDTLVQRAASAPNIGSVGPCILTSEGNVYPSARKIPSLKHGVGHAIFAGIWPANPWTKAYLNESSQVTEAQAVGWLSGACLLVRRSAFDQVGGFDENFFMYFEDVDLGHRLGANGFENVYEPLAIVTHTGAHSTSVHAADMLIAHHASAKRFLAKRYPGRFSWPLRLVVGLGLDIRAWIVTRSQRGTSE